MPLYIVATPIGNPEDISLRAIKIIKNAAVVIGEEPKELRAFLKAVGVPLHKTEDPQAAQPPELFFLNEHSQNSTVKELKEICKQKSVVLVSDCGTPGFCDPGADLVSLCRQEQISVTPIPGASSLMTLISVSGYRLKEFVFIGFLPAQTELRAKRILELKKERRPFVIMDTPYRLAKTVTELATALPEKRGVLGVNLTCANELILEGSLRSLEQKTQLAKGPFVLLVL